MAGDFDAFAARLTTPLTGLAQVLTGDREAGATLVHTALTRAYSEREPDEQRAIAALVRAWQAGAPPVGEHAELPDDLELFRRSLDALPEHQRLAVALHHWSGLPLPDIAAMLRRKESAVAADLAAGVAELPVPPESTVDAQLAALVAAAGPPLVDLTHVVEAGQAQRRHRRRTAVVAAGALLAAGTVAALLTSGEPDPATSERTPVRVVERFDGPPAVIDGRARRLTAQLTAAMAGVLPGAAQQAGFSPPEFRTAAEGSTEPTVYFADTSFDQTSLIFIVTSHTADTFVPCAEPGENCTAREFPDGTVAEVVIAPEADWQTLSLTARRPDGTALEVFTDGIGAPALTVENMFGFATVFTY